MPARSSVSPTRPLDPGRVAAFRLDRHRLSDRAPEGSAVKVAGELGGVQAQVMSSADLALRARVDWFGPTDLDRLL